MNYGLTIRLTNDCNLNCSFCSNKLLSPTDNTLTNVVETAGNILNKFPFSTVTILGGEPLLYIDFVNVLTKMGLAVGSQVNLMTNGVLWDDEVTKWANHNKVNVILGVQDIFSGEKPLFGVNNLTSIKEIENLTVRKVVFPHKKFAEDVILFHEILGCKVEIINDYGSLDKITVQSIYDVLNEINTIKKYGDIDWFSVHGMFTTHCDCKNNIEIRPDGSLTDIGELYGVTQGCDSGCAFYLKEMGDLYYSFRKLVRSALS